MNWEIIKKEYPKAFDRFRTYYILEVDYLVVDYENIILRFDTMPLVSISGYIHSFFDKHWIRCNYDKYLLSLSIYWGNDIISLYDLINTTGEKEWISLINSHEEYVTRIKGTTKIKQIIKAEQILFSKAFELLEEKLNNE